jgi:protein gp37
MSDRSRIEWCDASWNPVSGCSHVSPGCDHCYAETLSQRYKWTTKPWGAQHAAENVKLHPERLDQPLRWRKPRRIFVNSMSDLFHELVPFEFVDRVMTVMQAADHHVFQVLTKRPQRMLDYLSAWQKREPWSAPPKHVWWGVSVEDQRRADERIPLLLQTPAAVRWVSAEPLLGPLDLRPFMWPTQWSWDAKYRTPEEAVAAGAYAERKPQALVAAGRSFVRWVVVGGESGPGARPMDVHWARDIVAQCKAAGVPAFVKQLGVKPVERTNGVLTWPDYPLRDRKGGDPVEWPEGLHVREYPR